MIDKFFSLLSNWAANDEHIKSIIIVGSFAKGTHKATSDLDLCIITTNKNEMVKNQGFTLLFGEIIKAQTEYYGNCTSIRVWYTNGQEVEFGIVEPSWISEPLDAGTRKVLSDGYKIIIDKNDYFKSLHI